MVSSSDEVWRALISTEHCIWFHITGSAMPSILLSHFFLYLLEKFYYTFSRSLFDVSSQGGTMNRKYLLQSLVSVVVFGLAVLQSVGPAQAQEAQPQSQQLQLEQQVPPPQPAVVQPSPPPVIQTLPPVNTAGKMRLSLTGALGFGFDHVDVGITTGGDEVTISGGGGAGIGVGLGFGLSPDFDLDFDLGVQESTISPAVSNAEGSFTRSYLLVTLKRKIPTSESGQFKIGLGLGSYNNGTLDVDLGDAGGPHDIVEYKNALGFHVTGEFERFIGQTTSINLGAKMYFVKYKAKSWTQNGVSASVDNLNSDVKDFNGSGFDFMLGFNVYF